MKGYMKAAAELTIEQEERAIAQATKLAASEVEPELVLDSKDDAVTVDAGRIAHLNDVDDTTDGLDPRYVDELIENTWEGPEGGPKPTLRDADVYLDGMLEAEYQRIEGGAYDRASDETVAAAIEVLNSDSFAADVTAMVAKAEEIIQSEREAPEVTTTTDPRTDPRLNDVAFLATDEGQALLEAAAKVAKTSRKPVAEAITEADVDELIAETDAVLREAGREDLTITPKPRKPGEPDPAKAKAKAELAAKVAAKAAAKRPSTPAAKVAAAAKAADEAVAKGERKPRTKHQALIAVDAAKAKAVAKAKVDGANRPLSLGTKPILVGDVQQYPILHRDGSVALHQADNYIWKCPQCGRRLRDVACAKDHKVVKAPAGYRRADRVVI